MYRAVVRPEKVLEENQDMTQSHAMTGTQRRAQSSLGCVARASG